MGRTLATVVTLALLSAACGPVAPAASGAPAPPERRTVTIAYADDPSRVALLWAITNRKISSPSVDLAVSFLPLAQIIPAANTKQFDVIEATPLAVPRTAGREPGFLILSAGLVNVDGTFLVTGRTSPIRTAADLAGKTIAVPSLGGTFVQETRYVLAKKFGLNVDLRTGDVKFVETPPEAVAQLLKEGKLDAAVLTQLGAYRLKDSPDVRVLSEVAKELEQLTGKRAAASVVVTYRDRAAAQGPALAEVQRLLSASRAYLADHRAEVLAAVAAEKKVDLAFLNWFFSAYDLRGGPLTAADTAEIVASWEAAKGLGDIAELPRFADVVFTAR
ncbi:MAG TPA: MqnA/MqnD/SBP family protein [Candidatus Saccharimonadales bacterium]|nr:MqnA/MqnD/SBP family protein [Candidatus Saccharimonadales bacterium]